MSPTWSELFVALAVHVHDLAAESARRAAARVIAPSWRDPVGRD
ncbi:hypothetical protein [Kibdelosporangium philippinense]